MSTVTLTCAGWWPPPYDLVVCVIVVVVSSRVAERAEAEVVVTESRLEELCCTGLSLVS